ncbi:MAG TPA: hypothetical protein VNQ90_08485 [Chthoniobacteraceae bacterium]|nr:hypothetical protein [Chthoniobacteraceae bacterium]
MKKTALFCLLLLPGNGWLAAQTAEDLQIENRSSYEAPSTGRNPFWPVGWSKQATATVGAAAAPVQTIDTSFLVPSRFVVSSISIGKIPLAVINGKTYGEGDLIAVTNGPNRVNVQVVAIKDGKVRLRYATKTIESSIQGQQPQKR